MLKLKMMLCVMMLPLVVVGCTSAVCQSVREATITASGVDNAASPRLADTAERGLFYPQREADHYAKTTGSEPRSILMSSAEQSCPYRWAPIIIAGVIHTRFQRSINA